MLFELVRNVDALAAYAGIPPKVIEAKVVDFNVVEFAAQNLRHAGFNLYRHIADVENASVWTQLVHRLGYDGSGVRVVDDPVVLAGVLLAEIDKLAHGEDGPHAIGHATCSAGLLADYAMAQADLLILDTHLEPAHAHLRHNKVRICKRLFGVDGYMQGDLGGKVIDNCLNHHSDRVLAFLVDVIEPKLTNPQFVLLINQVFDDTGGIGAAAAADDNLVSVHVVHAFQIKLSCRQSWLLSARSR